MSAERPAALPMYDADRAAVDAFWRGLRSALRAEGVDGVPVSPGWPAALPAHWLDPALLLSQTCGYPLVTRLRGQVQVVGAFRYTAPGCAGSAYRSALLVRRDEPAGALEGFRDRIAAVNNPDSHSGCNALRHLVAPLARGGRFFARALESGSHRASIDLVRSGRADLASVDAVSWAGLQRAEPAGGEGLRVPGWTVAVPGLPLITSRQTTADDLVRLRRALAATCADPALAGPCAALFIDSFDAADADAWQVVEDQRRAALALGCPGL